MEENYELLKELGSGNFGVARLVRHKKTNELLAVKYIERGKKARRTPITNNPLLFQSQFLLSTDIPSNPQIDEKVQREIINHRSLRHPNIIQFREVCKK